MRQLESWCFKRSPSPPHPRTSVRGWESRKRTGIILYGMNVELVGTTDDPADPLDWHAKIAASNLATRVVPTFRPDAALKVQQPEKVQAWARRLGDTAGTAATAAEAETFMAFFMRHVARLNHAKGWVTQLHLGAFRDPNPPLTARLGSDAGADTIGDARQGPGLVRFMGTLVAEGCLGRTILYNINPADNALFGGLPGSFQDGVIPGKIQWGSGWWFMDQERGMRDQMNMLSDLGLLSRFVGMVTDSRSFLSYPRHEYFRRILCDLLGADVESGRLPDRRDWLDTLVADVCCRNARALFGGGT